MLDDLKADLIRDESFVSHAYQDSEGYWTIGIGRLVDKRRGGGVTRYEAEYLLGNDIAAVLAELDRAIPWWGELPQPVRRGLANMAFNLGWPRLSGFKKMLAALESGDFATAAIEAMDSKWARQVGPRATRIAEMFRNA